MELELVGEECLQDQEPRKMITSNLVQDLDATEPRMKSTKNVRMMNHMAVPSMVAEVTVVENQLMAKMIAVVADKAMVEANLAMAVAENLVTAEAKVTDAGAVMMTNLSSRLVLDEEGMDVVAVDMERVDMLRKDTDVDVDVVVVMVERLDTRKTCMVRMRMALAVLLRKVCLLSFLIFSHNSSLTHNLQLTHMHTYQLSHPRMTNIQIQNYSTKLRRNFIIVSNFYPSTINIRVEVLEREANMIPSSLILRTTHRHMRTLRFLVYSIIISNYS